MSFISKYLEHTQIYESPSSFWRFSAYTIISAILRDNVFLKQGDKITYPNLYTLLLADSAIQRKGNPVEMAEKLVRSVNNTKILSGRTSVQAILDVLARAETDKKSGELIKGGAAIIFAPELSAAIVADPQSVSILTDLYDLKNDYVDNLRKGTLKIDKVVFSLFAGSNETLLKNVYDANAIHGGLLGRTLIVKPDEFRKAASLLSTPDTTQSYNELVASLKIIVKTMKGEMTLTQDAKDSFNSWYEPFRESYKTRTDSTGVAGRMHATILKLSIVLAANDISLIVRKEHIDESIDICTALIPNYKSFTIASGKGDLATAGAILLQALLEAPPIYKLTRKEILRSHWQDIDAEMLSKLVETLEQADVIKRDVMGNDEAYALTSKALDGMSIKVEKK